MKIKIVGFPFLHDRLLEEGNEFVKSGEDIFLNEQADGELPRVVVESLGLEVRQEKEYFSVVKFFHEGFSSQTIVAIPMRGFMPGGLGLDMVSGYACRFVDKAPPLFENESLGEMLREMRYTGFLTAGFGRDLCSLRLGAGLVFYNVLEGIPGLLTDFLTKRGRLLESWTYSVLLSRYPFPAEGKAERIAFAVDPSASRHLHFFGASRKGHVYQTTETKIGVGTSWATTMNDAAKRVLRTLGELKIPNKQYRTDLVQACPWQDIKGHRAIS